MGRSQYLAVLSFPMPLEVFWGLFNVLQRCCVLLALLCLQVLASLCLCCSMNCFIPASLLMLEFNVLNRKLLEDVAQLAASLSYCSRDNQDL